MAGAIQENHLPIRWLLQQVFHRHSAIGTGHIIDDHIDAQILTQRGSKRTRQRIQTAAGIPAHQQCHASAGHPLAVFVDCDLAVTVALCVVGLTAGSQK